MKKIQEECVTLVIHKREKIFKDVDVKTGKEKKWKLEKKEVKFVMSSYERLKNFPKADRLRGCATFLQFKKFKIDDSLKLTFANFCQCRLCPMCAKRRSLKVFSQTSKIMNIIKDDYAFLFLTLTLKTCENEELKEQMDLMFKSFNKMFQRKAIKQISKGWFRALEIVHDPQVKITKEMYKKKKDYYDFRGLKVGDDNPNYTKYHAHLHVIVAVNKSYFTSRYYLNHDEWVKLWKESTKVNYDPIVNIKRFNRNRNIQKSVNEAAKYTVKSSDYIIKNDMELTDKVIETLDKALAYRRLVAYGGRLKEVHKELNLDDPIDGDLVNAEIEDEVRFDDFMILNVRWNVGLQNYFIDDEFEA